MKKKKGFTLIELLASLVILAFILVIAVPRIVNAPNQNCIDELQYMVDPKITLALKNAG